MRWSFNKRVQSVVGVAFDEGRWWLVRAVCGKNGAEAVQTTTVALTADPLSGNIESVGHEIKAQLEAARIKEKHLVVALPAAAVMSVATALPTGLSAEDLASLLRIEAEKTLPSDPDELQIAVSRLTAGTTEHATQLAVRREHLANLTAALRVAGLKPLSYTLGFDALAGAVPPAGQGRITLALTAGGAAVLVAAGGGVAAFRTFEVSPAGSAAAIAREMRITLEQVSPDLRQQVTQLRIQADPAITAGVEDAAAEWARMSGLTIERTVADGRSLGADIAQAIALRYLGAGEGALEFLPPRPSRWAALMARYNSPRLATAGFSAAGLALLAILAFGWHEYRYWSLARQWDAMAAQVKDLTAMNDRVREYRPWYDTSLRNLTILRRIVECFPENGSVSAKAVEIHGTGAVTITGTAADNGSLLHTVDELRKTREVQNLKIEQIRGKTPAQFSFTFRWAAHSGT